MGGALRVLAVLILAILFLIPVALPAAGRGEEDLENVRALRRRLTPDAEEVIWRFAVGVVVAEGASPTDHPLFGSFVRVLQDTVEGIPERYLSAEERGSWGERVVHDQRRRLLGRIDRRVETLDRRSLESGAADTAVSAGTVRADPEYRSLREELRILELLRQEPLEIPETAQLRAVREEFRYRRVLHGPAATADALDVDTLLYLLVDPVEDLLFLRVRAYHRLTGVDREVLRLVATPEDMPRRLEGSRRALVQELTGRDLAALEVSVVDAVGMPEETARIRLGDELLAMGRLEEPFLLPGEYRVRASTDDGRTVEEVLQLQEGERRVVSLSLPETTARTVRIETTPPGARVYQGALWVGITPVEIPRPSVPREFTISLRGYYDSRVQLGPDSPDRVRRSLVTTDTDWYGQVTESRTRFYRSFGAFALSLGVPILINGMYQNMGGLFPGGVARSDLSASAQDDALSQANALLVGYYAGVGLSTALFGNMVWRLVQYIRTAQEYHVR